ncbi:M48 family metalloprotease [Halomicrobium salinisoli]|uniref:M48 family metalloprotease n=1 Tax=Halomicrobium salinisoli TaxID=2878391 RepID=UPI001CF010FC|nr:M48 family metalloprotease [Halomicrobium salinisoli]
MGAFRLVYSHSRLNVEQMRVELREQFLAERCEHDDVEYDPDSMTGFWRGNLGTVFYEWDVEPDPETSSYVLRQRVRFSSGTIKRFALHVAIWLGFWAVLYRVQTSRIAVADLNLFTVLGATVAGVGLLLFGLYDALRLLDLEQYPDPLIDGRDVGFRYERYRPVRVLQWLDGLNKVGLAAAFVAADPGITFRLGAAYGTLAAAFLAVWFADGGERLVALMDRSAIGDLRRSGLGKRYVQYTWRLSIWILVAPLLTVAAPGLVRRYVAFEDASVLERFTAEAPHSVPMVDTLLSLALVAIAVTLFRNLSDEQFKMEYFDFERRETTWIGRLVDASAVAVSSVLAYVALLKAAEVLLGVPAPLLPDSALDLPKTSVVAALLALYPLAGVAYQYRKRTRGIEAMLAKSTPDRIEVSDPDGTTFEAPFRVLDAAKHDATSVRFDGEDHVIVTRGLAEDPAVGDRELAAIVAHERGHVANGDTRLCNRILLASSALLVGQNVLYDVVDFYEREFRADEYAADAVGSEAVKDALRVLRESDDAGDTSRSFGPNFGPGFALADRAPRLTQPFELFFGGFAVSEAHPSFDERIERLSSGDESPSDSGAGSARSSRAEP